MARAPAEGSRWLPPGWHVVVATVERFYADRCLVAAAALTYTSLLSLVPLFALMFAVLKGLGAQHRLEPLLLSRLSLDPVVTERLLTFIDRTNVGTIGAIGAVFLIFTVISVLGSIESIFNMIWRVVEGRTWYRKVTDYVSVVLLIPFLLLFAVGLTSMAREQAALRWLLEVEVLHGLALLALRLAPVAMNVIALGMLYAVMPNRRPDVRSILIAALVAGIAWQLVQLGYVSLQIGVARANAIYGALAQLPVTLVWIYVSWAVVLAGAELAAVVEYGPEPEDEGARDVSRWAVALHVLVRAADHFRGDGEALDVGDVAKEIDVNSDLLSEVVAKLRAERVLAAVDGESERYVLARDPVAIDLARVAEAFGEARPPVGADERVSEIFEHLANVRREWLEGTSLASLAGRSGAVDAHRDDGSPVSRSPRPPQVRADSG